MLDKKISKDLTCSENWFKKEEGNTTSFKLI
jgi:hypothetical protein